MPQNGRVPDSPDPLDAAARELYALAPDDFLARRAELVNQAKKAGDAVTAQAIGKLRKPTVAAWVVNALALQDPSVAKRLCELGDRLRAAQDALDAGRLRELSTERRSLVAELTNDAFRLAGRKQPPAALRDEVTGTFDAAIADAEVAGRLGRLVRAEQWSGFGFLPTGGPELTLVRGGRDAEPAKKAKPRVDPAERRRRQKDLTKARDAFDAATKAYEQAHDTEAELAQEVKRLTRKLAKLQDRLDEARGELEDARRETAQSRGARREARSALDRAEREADEG